MIADQSGRSPDGTTILSSSADKTLRSFVLPSDLLSPDAASPHTLTPYALHRPPETVYATTFHPAYALQEPSSCLILASPCSLPIRLFSPFAPGILASYPLVSPTTEAYITPHSLLFSAENPNQFLAGSDSQLCVFDVNRNGEGPISKLWTTASRRNHKAMGAGMKGIISVMAMGGEGLLAAGTFTRWVGLYDGFGRGGEVGVFSVASTEQKEEGSDGMGITQVLWSRCGRYLCTVERSSDGIGIWDIRGSGKRLAWLKGRKAVTQQRMSVDIMGGEVWAGGTDGMVRVWERLGMTEGVVDPKWKFHAHGDVVTSTMLHPTGSVMATCSGQRHYPASLDFGSEEIERDTDRSDATSQSSRSSPSTQPSMSTDSDAGPARAFENSLKIWAL